MKIEQILADLKNQYESDRSHYKEQYFKAVSEHKYDEADDHQRMMDISLHKMDVLGEIRERMQEQT